jgi:hypothetical protein
MSAFELPEELSARMRKVAEEMIQAPPLRRHVTVRKAGMDMPVSRELLLDHGLVEPTPEERAQAEHDAAVAEQRRAEHDAALAVAREQLAGIVEEPARTILDLHRENERGECEGCDFGGYEAERPYWPCITVRTIARHYRIDLGETR